MNQVNNPELDLAYEYVNGTHTSLFLTGKAGSGKTTFLRKIQQEGSKRLVVLAPTGVAAINAGGMTIHSFFQLPFGLHLPDVRRQNNDRQHRFSRNVMLTAKLIESSASPMTRFTYAVLAMNWISRSYPMNGKM